ncbi:MAG: dihydrodipicolinate synthase family protein [Spirochaetaceae bacterium]
MNRAELFESFFAGRAPTLWCPLISHYDGRGNFDEKRFSAHITALSPYVGGYLAPGSTGDGWEMGESEAMELVDLLREVLVRHQRLLLVGVLKTKRGEAARAAEVVKSRFGFDGRPGSLKTEGVCGITVTAPKGADLPQELIEEELSSILSVGLPTALYQLPQITENNISPETAASLASAHPNFYLFKDTGGEDRVALEAELPDDLFLVRGAEGGYYRWLRGAGGPYNGFLLSTANSFAGELSRIIEAVEEGSIERAKELSDTLSRTVQEAFSIVEPLPFGNPFANANKAVDHFMAYGHAWNKADFPMTHAKERMPGQVMEKISELLQREHLMPSTGYLDA